jgi:hypothetical protein
MKLLRKLWLADSLITRISQLSVAAVLLIFYSHFSDAADITLSALQPTTTAATAPLATVSTAAPLGTLFLTPAERAALEAARLKRNLPPQPSTKFIPKTVDQAPLATTTITGLMKRSDGTIAVWVNGVLAPNFPTAMAQRLTSSDVGMPHNADTKTTKPNLLSPRGKASIVVAPTKSTPTH